MGWIPFLCKLSLRRSVSYETQTDFLCRISTEAIVLEMANFGQQWNASHTPRKNG